MLYCLSNKIHYEAIMISVHVIPCIWNMHALYLSCCVICDFVTRAVHCHMSLVTNAVLWMLRLQIDIGTTHNIGDFCQTHSNLAINLLSCEIVIVKV